MSKMTGIRLLAYLRGMGWGEVGKGGDGRGDGRSELKTVEGELGQGVGRGGERGNLEVHGGRGGGVMRGEGALSLPGLSMKRLGDRRNGRKKHIVCHLHPRQSVHPDPPVPSSLLTCRERLPPRSTSPLHYYVKPTRMSTTEELSRSMTNSAVARRTSTRPCLRWVGSCTVFFGVMRYLAHDFTQISL